jgi:hypothetical protein
MRGFVRLLKNSLRDGALHRWQRRLKDRKTLSAWKKRGCPTPPPQAFKRKLIRELADRFNTRILVETGTNWGDTIAASLGSFDTIYSIELMDDLYQHARRRFARFHKVKLYLGDSAEELSKILAGISGPAIFWLDGHYSGEGTARGNIDTPINQELLVIARQSKTKHVVLIDDARLFDGTCGYPTLELCCKNAAEYWPNHSIEVAHDVIRIVPPRSR